MKILILAIFLVYILHTSITEATTDLCNIRDFYQVCEKTVTVNRPSPRFPHNILRGLVGRGKRSFFRRLIRPSGLRIGSLIRKVNRRREPTTIKQVFKCPSVRPTQQCLEVLRDHTVTCQPCCNKPTPVIRHCNTFPGSIIQSRQVNVFMKAVARGRGVAAANAPSSGQDVYVRESFRNLVNIPDRSRLMS